MSKPSLSPVCAIVIPSGALKSKDVMVTSGSSVAKITAFANYE